MTTQLCRSCHISKPISEFYTCVNKGKRVPLKRCKSCCLAYRKEWKQRPGVLERLAKTQRKRVELDRTKFRMTAAKHYYGQTFKRATGDKSKELCRILLQRAVRDGVILKPDLCPECGNTGRIDAHHSDYAKPFEVEWLCSICHGKRHRKYSDSLITA